MIGMFLTIDLRHKWTFKKLNLNTKYVKKMIIGMFGLFVPFLILSPP